MTNEERDKIFLENVKTVLDQDTADLDAATLSRLRQIRYAAMEESETSQSNWWRRFRLPAVALVTASLIATFTFVQMRTPEELSATNTFEDMEIIASNDQLDLYEDFDFYAWLAEEQQNAS